MANEKIFEGFSLKMPTEIKELNGTHIDNQQFDFNSSNNTLLKDKELTGTHTDKQVYIPDSANGLSKDTAIQQLQTAIDALAAKIQPQDNTLLLAEFRKIQAENQFVLPDELLNTLKTLQLFQAKVEQKLDLLMRLQQKPKDMPAQDEALEKLQTHSLYLAKIEQKLEILNRTQAKQQAQPQPTPTQDEALEKLQTHSLYLAKIEQKLEILNRTQAKQQAQPQPEPTQDETNEKLQTQSLYLAKMEQKLELIQRALQKMQKPTQQEDNNEKWQTNNLFLAKIEQKLELLSRMQQKAQVQNIVQNTDETNEKLQTNNLYLAKIEQKMELLSRMQQKNNSPSDLPEKWQAQTLEKLDGYQITLNSIAQDIQNMQSNVANLQENQTKIEDKSLLENITQPSLENTLPAPEFWDKLQIVIKHIMETLAPTPTNTEQGNSTDAILSGLHTNNVYLSKMEQRLEALNKTIEKVMLKKT